MNLVSWNPMIASLSMSRPLAPRPRRTLAGRQALALEYHDDLQHSDTATVVELRTHPRPSLIAQLQLAALYVGSG